MSSIPFVIGITGHRDLRPQDIPLLTRMIREQFSRWMRMCPHTDFYCMTSLAEGADQLCGSIAVELGMHLIVPLPMEQVDYEQDFSGTALEQFRALLDRADRVFVAPDIEKQARADSDYAYRKAGIYLARHCHVLLALWDGLAGESGCCGTAETVEFKTKKRYSAPDSLLNTPSEGLALQLVTPRATKEAMPENALTLRWLCDPATLENLLNQTEAFNRDALRADVSTSEGVLDEQTVQAIGEAAGTLQQVYLRADALALRYRDIYLTLIKLLCAVGALLVACFLFYDELESNLFLVVYGLVALAALVLYLIAKRDGCHRRYIEYRLFSETLRVQLNLCASGLSICADDLTSWSQKTICPWIQAAINALQLFPSEKACTRADVRAIWLQKQLEYQTAAYQANLKKQKHQSRISGVLLSATILFFVVVLVLEFLFPAWIGREIALPDWLLRLAQAHGAHFFSMRSVMKILLGIIPAFAFVVTSYYGKLSLARKLADGTRMIALYSQALIAYDDPQTDQNRLLTELAREELAETGGWFSYVSENTPDILI